jgi:hypothetical protein
MALEYFNLRGQDMCISAVSNFWDVFHNNEFKRISSVDFERKLEKAWQQTFPWIVCLLMAVSIREALARWATDYASWVKRLTKIFVEPI